MLKPSPLPSPKPSLLAWALYALAAALFLAGQALLLKGGLLFGGALTGGGILAGLLGYFEASLPLARLASRLPRPRRGAATPAEARASSEGPGALRGPALSLGQRVDQALTLLPDSLSLSRYWLLAPVVAFLALSQWALGAGGTTRAVLFFLGAGILAWVYLQDLNLPLRLPALRQNALALLWMAPALPFQALGAYLMSAHFHKPYVTWIGTFLCAVSSAYMLWSLRRRPLDLEIKDEAPAPQGAAAETPFFSASRLTLMSVLLTASAVSAYLAMVAFPAQHPGWSVGAGFLSMALLIGSMPWLPKGFAWLSSMPPAGTAVVACASVVMAMVLGVRGQDLIDTGQVNAGLWWFLAGGITLVLGLSQGRNAGILPERSGGQGASRWEIATVLLLTLVAFAFRAWNINDFPWGAEGDEAGGGVWAVDTLKGNVEHPLIHQNYPLAFFSVTALFFKLAGITVGTLRWHSVLFGTLSILTTYFFLRLVVGRWTAFLCTLLMGFSYWHLHFSRFGHYNIEQVALQMVAFYFVFKAMTSQGRYWHWWVGGLAFGLAMFPHMAGRLLPFQGIALVLYFFVLRRDLLRRHLPGFLAFVLGAWAIASTAVVYWERARGISMGRIQSVSIFDKNNTNAPVDTLAGFVRNCKVSMLMFNHVGDSRHRDNPLASEKILERWTAILFGLALLYALWHWRDPLVFFLLSAFFINMAASVFSVEAPQTLRTAGNIPLVFALIGLPLFHLRQALQRPDKRLANWAFLLVLLPAFAFFSYRSGQKLFVQARNLSFDVHPTVIAEIAGREGGPQDQAAFWATGFASSHPPVMLFAQQTPIRNFYSLVEYLPVTTASDRDHLLFLSDEYQQLLPYLKWLYPGAEYKSVPNALGGPDVVSYGKFSSAQLQSIQGLKAKVRMGEKTVVVEGVAPRWPVQSHLGASEAEFEGSLYLESSGHYTFDAEGAGDVDVWVDGKPVLSRKKGGPAQVERRLLGRGLHGFRARLRPATGADNIFLKAQVTAQPLLSVFTQLRGGSEMVLEKNRTFRMAPHGLYAEYFSSRLPEGQAVGEAIEPAVFNHWLDSPLAGNYSTRWRARFKAGTPGNYRFIFKGSAVASQIRVNGQLVWHEGGFWDGSGPAPGRVNREIQLAAGWHDYEAVSSHTGPPMAELRVTGPDGAERPLMPEELQPVFPR